MKRVLLVTSLLLLAFPCLAFQAAMAQPTHSSMEQSIPSYPNRIVLIRHAEKGWSAGQNASSVSTEDGWPGKHARPSAGEAPHREFPGGRGGGGPPGRGGPGRGGPRGRGGPPGRGGGGWPGKGGRRGPPNGLSEIGKQRAKFLPVLFGEGSEYNFGKILAAPRDAHAKEEERTYATVAPLAEHLGLTIDISCANSDHSCIVEAVEAFARTSGADILISWKHFELNQIATALGAHNAHSIYPDQRNDIIWIMQNGAIVEKRSMHCPELDDDRIDEGDPDLVVEEPSEGSVWEGLKGVVVDVAKGVAGVFGA